MDTVSIPQNHQLRREAISNINTVFLDSCAVLVCDRDLMQVDVSNVTLPLLESLLVGVLVCDWNVRAWTLLEAVKGRAKLHLLCKNNRTVDLQDLLQTVCSHGRLDVAIFANLLHHMLLKWEDSEKPMIFPRKLGVPKFMRGLVSRRRRQTVEIQIPIGLGGVWLSHRPASRPEDEIVIWSLLLGDLRPPLYNAVDFWRSNYMVDTGYLLSSCPRLNKRGLSWAPRTPYAMVQQSGPVPSPDRILPRHTTIGALGSIQRNGLWASWYVSEFDSRNQTSTQSQAQVGRELAKIRQRFHITKRYAALLQPIDANDHRIFGEKRREDAVQPGRFGRQVAICESGKRRMKREEKEMYYTCRQSCIAGSGRESTSGRIMCQCRISRPATDFGLDEDDTIYDRRVERPSQALFGLHEVHVSDLMRGGDIHSPVFRKSQHILRRNGCNTMQLLRALRKPYPTIHDFEVSKEIEIFGLSLTARNMAKEVSDNTNAVG